MENLFRKFMIIAALFIFVACEEEDGNGLVDPPTEADAAFTYEATAENDNIIEFTATVDGFNRYSWDLGNGENAPEAQTVTGTYPTAGTYTVTLTVFNDGGSASSSQDIVIAETDPTLLDDPIYNILTGGVDMPEGKTWVVDSARAGHFGVGPNPVSDAGPIPEYYAAGANEKSGAGMYDDRYTFTLESFGFNMQTNGDVYVNSAHGDAFEETYDPGVGDLTAFFTPSEDLTWSVAKTDTEGEYNTLTISPDGFIGYYAGARTYQLITLEENEILLRFVDTINGDLAWYIRLIPAGFDSGGGDGGEEPGTVTATLPIGFETQEPTLEVFGGSTAQIIDNPNKSGINTSDKVLETVHGGEAWAGLFFELEEALPIGTGSTVTLKVWAPATGVFRFKLENLNDNTDSYEIDQNIETANEWVELTFDVSGASEQSLGRVVLFPGWDVPNAGTFYIDDVSFQE